jgi:hypothetical protein
MPHRAVSQALADAAKLPAHDPKVSALPHGRIAGLDWIRAPDLLMLARLLSQ